MGLPGFEPGISRPPAANHTKLDHNPVYTRDRPSILKASGMLLGFIHYMTLMVDMDPTYDNPRDYQGYELSAEERRSVDQIRRSADMGYHDQDTLRAHIDYCEQLRKRLNEILRNEESIGYVNDTLRHDAERVRALAQRLDNILARMDL